MIAVWIAISLITIIIVILFIKTINNNQLINKSHHELIEELNQMRDEIDSIDHYVTSMNDEIDKETSEIKYKLDELKVQVEAAKNKH